MKNDSLLKKIALCRDQETGSKPFFRGTLPSEHRSESGEVMPLVGRPLPAWYKTSILRRVSRGMPTKAEPSAKTFIMLSRIIGRFLSDPNRPVRKNKSDNCSITNASGRSSRASGEERGNMAFSSAEVSSAVASCQPDNNPGRERSSSGSSDLRSILSLKRRGTPSRHCAVVASPLSGGSSREAEIDEIVKRTKYYSRQVTDRGQV